MKNKKNFFPIIVLNIACLLLTYASCSDNVFDLDNNNATSTFSFGDSISAKAAINGAFHSFTGTFFWGRIVHIGALMRSDEFNNLPFGDNTANVTFQATTAGRWSVEMWNELYKCVNRCNNVILNVNENTITSKTTRQNIVGQAYFLRGLAYWYLVNIYGNVPLVITATDFNNLNVSQVPVADVWTQIISDLKNAETMLPNSWAGTDLGRPTSYSATALKGKSYLYLKDWSNATTAFNTIVTSGNFSLLPSKQYGENFSEANENNAESVFELQFQGVETFVWGFDIPGSGTMGNFHIDYATPDESPDLGYAFNPWLKTLYENNGDTIRRNETLTYDYPGATAYGGAPFKTDLAPDIVILTDQDVEAIFGKKYSGMSIGSKDAVDFLGTNVGTNWRLIRYSDVLLMLAEALNEQGSTAEAIKHVNAVRTRAQITSLSSSISQTDLRQAIIDERAMELAGEGHRFFDLVRWDLAETYLGATSKHVTDGSQSYHPKSISGGTFQKGKHELLWIPQSELDANDSLVQNPGW